MKKAEQKMKLKINENAKLCKNKQTNFAKR